MPSHFVIYMEFTLPPEAGLEAVAPLRANLMESFQTLRRVFADIAPVLGTRLLQNTEDPKVILLEISSTTDILDQVRGALNVPGVKTRAWAFSVVSDTVTRDLAQA